MARYKSDGVKTVVVNTIADIPVYPVFGCARHSYNLVDNPHICEDDRGRIAFVSNEAKEAFLRDYNTGRRVK